MDGYDQNVPYTCMVFQRTKILFIKNFVDPSPHIFMFSILPLPPLPDSGFLHLRCIKVHPRFSMYQYFIPFVAKLHSVIYIP